MTETKKERTNLCCWHCGCVHPAALGCLDERGFWTCGDCHERRRFSRFAELGGQLLSDSEETEFGYVGVPS